RSPGDGASGSGGQGDVVARLCQHLTRDRRKVLVDTSQPETIWSDGAIFEIAANYPPALQEMISHPTGNRDIRSFVKTLVPRLPAEWKEASIKTSPRGDRYFSIQSNDGTVTATIDALYVEYVQYRYPTAMVKVKGEFEPVVFLVDGQL